MSEQRNSEEIVHIDDKGASSWEECVFELFSPESNLMGEAFFEKSILKLNEFVGADYCFVGKLHENGRQFDSIAICNKNHLLAPYSFEFNDTPFTEVVKNACVTFKRGVQEDFPNDSRLREANIKSYYGVPLYDSKKNVVGVLAAFFETQQESERKVESLLYMFSSRIGSELEHLEKERELKRRNLELLVFKEELLRKNQELDSINKELKMVSSKAEESNKLKSSFLANLSHEIRTPMNAIIGFTELLRSDSISNNEKIEYLDIVYQNGNQLMRVMDALIDISKLQARTAIDAKEMISVNKIIAEIKEQYAEEIEICQKPIEMHLYKDVEDGDDILYTFKDAFIKVLNQLLENAVKFTASGEIVLGYYILDDCIEFFVEDTGVGIKEGQEEQIFDMFRQGDVNKTREFGGTGIGLSIVAKYIEMMGGKVWAEPQRDKGALFKFQIPSSL